MVRPKLASPVVKILAWVVDPDQVPYNKLVMIKPQQFTAKFEDKTEHNAKYVQMAFELVEPSRMEFKAGQYVSIKVDDSGARRPYSICSRPDIDHGFELLIDMTPQGLGTTYLEKLQFGDQIEILAPMGHFTMSKHQDADPAVKPDKSLVFVATGSGIAPFYSMIQDQLQLKQDSRQIYLYWGLRYIEHLFWQDEFERMAEAFPNFHFHPVISRPVPDWMLCRGRVTDCLVVHDLPENPSFYLCGNQAMIDDVTKLLTERKIPAEDIHFEKFF